MSVQITYFVHGTTIDNENSIATGWDSGMLSGRGVKESKNLGTKVAERKFDAVYCSDLKRAIDSAQLAFGERYEIIQDERLREVNYGDLTGKSNSFKDKLTDYIDNPFPNGESYGDVENRINKFIDFLKQNYNNKHVAIVAHQGTQLAFEVLANNKSWQQAIAEDWRKAGKWQPGWGYYI